MTQDKGIVIGLSILPVKVISGEMTGFLELIPYYEEKSLNLYLINL
jgi:hypothetical protein